MSLSKRRDERQDKIKQLVDLSNKTEDLFFRKNTYPCPCIEISNEYLIYRLDNTRTVSAQPEYIEEKGLDANFFDDARTEVSEVQVIQHELLWKEVDKPLKDSFNMHDGQTESILINQYGIVINGNRRLRLMRERNQELIKCMVVTDPNLAGKEFQIEAFLDMTPETKKDYVWHAAASTMKKMLDLGMTYEEIAQERGQPSGKEVQQMIKAREIAAEGLKDQGNPNKWSLVTKSEQIYMDTAAKKISNASQARAAELSTIIIDNATNDSIEGRAYNLNKKVLGNPELAVEVFSEIAPDNNEQLINPITDEIDVSSGFNEVILKEKIKDDPDLNDEIVSRIKEKIDEKEDIKASAGQKKSLQKKINQAANNLNSAADCTSITGLAIEGIQDKIDQMKESIRIIENYIDSQ
jgi:ParB-like chromosome segregation protein Spo0J